MGKITENILEHLQFQAEDSVDLFLTLSTDRRSASRRIRRYFRQGPPEFKKNWVEMHKQRQSFYSLLNQLKRDGLVEKRKKGRQSSWSITARGRDRLVTMQKGSGRVPNIVGKGYKLDGNGPLIIVSYDIPESVRKKRYWLRANLIALGFARLHQSVWMGKIKLSKDFIYDLRKQDILHCVHIFSVNKSGSLQKLA